MEQILKTVPVDLRVKMEALVHDLTLALEESNNNVHVKRRWGIRRRARSTGNIPSFTISKISEDSSSSMCDIHLKKHIEMPPVTFRYQSDSDDTNYSKRFAQFTKINNISNIESDSVNENIIPRTITRRKRKFKKMAIDSDSNPSTSQTMTNIVNSSEKKKRFFRNDCEDRYDLICCGKRKRSCRERSTDCEMQSTRLIRNTKIKNKNKCQDEDAMDCSRISSSSISSSDSEAGILTNEEDREGDDEQSDWIGESNWWDDSENKNDEKSSSNSTFQSVIHGNIDNYNDESKRNYRQKIQWIRDGLSGREILAGRRHVDNTPGYSIITSANEKVSRFLQDPNQNELKLHPIRQLEREKLRRLANLYNLNLKGDLTCPILYKTRYTTQAICVDQVSLKRLSDYKRLRKTPPNSPNPDSEIHNYKYDSSTTINELLNSESSVHLTKNTLGDWEINKIVTDIPIKLRTQNFSHSKSS